MHLSNEIQRRLNKFKSNIKLSSTIDGIFPNNYSFINKLGRTFRTEFASDYKSYSIVLFERTDKLGYENCFARGLFTDLDRLTSTINLWVSKQEEILEIKKKFEELELYSELEIKNPNRNIDRAWTKVMNMFFNDTEFWKHTEWNNRYVELLNKAKRNNAFNNYFPFTSHYWLRFSIDSNHRITWPLDTYIIPTMYSPEVPRILGNFYVSYNDNPLDGRYFDTANEGLNFYALKLKEIEPINWGKDNNDRSTSP